MRRRRRRRSWALLRSRASCSAAVTPPATWNCTICQRAGCWRTPSVSRARRCSSRSPSLWRTLGRNPPAARCRRAPPISQLPAHAGAGLRRRSGNGSRRRRRRHRFSRPANGTPTPTPWQALLASHVARWIGRRRVEGGGGGGSGAWRTGQQHAESALLERLRLPESQAATRSTVAAFDLHRGGFGACSSLGVWAGSAPSLAEDASVGSPKLRAVESSHAGGDGSPGEAAAATGDWRRATHARITSGCSCVADASTTEPPRNMANQGIHVGGLGVAGVDDEIGVQGGDGALPMRRPFATATISRLLFAPGLRAGAAHPAEVAALRRVRL